MIRQALLDSVFDILGERFPMTPTEKSKRLLDVGTGSQEIFACMGSQWYSQIVGVDTRLSALLATPQSPTGTHKCCAAAAALPFPNGIFDVVTYVRSIWCLADLRGALGESRRVLGPGGILVVQTWGNRRECSLLTLGLAFLGRHFPALRVPDHAMGPFEYTPEYLACEGNAIGLDIALSTHHSKSFVVTNAAHYWQLFGQIAETAMAELDSLSGAHREAVTRSFSRSFDSYMARHGTPPLKVTWDLSVFVVKRNTGNAK